MEMRTVLYVADCQDPTQSALRHAVSLASDYDARLVILHLVGGDGVQRVDGDALGGFPTSPTNGVLAKTRVQVIYQAREGNPLQAILEVADEVESDVIVMSAGSPGLLQRLFRRSLAEKVLQRASCPVWVVRPAMSPRPTNYLPVKSGRNSNARNGSSDDGQAPRATCNFKAVDSKTIVCNV